MDIEVVGRLRRVLARTGWLEQAEALATAVRASTRIPSGLLVVGTAGHEPRHLTGHLDDAARLAREPALRPVLVRHDPPAGAPPSLAHGLERLTTAGRGCTVLVVAPGPADDEVLDRVADARRRAATVLAVDAGDPRLDGLAHERLTVTRGPHLPHDARIVASLLGADVFDSEPESVLPFDLAEHLLAAAVTPRRDASAVGRLLTLVGLR
jgi:hypothetical protein